MKILLVTFSALLFVCSVFGQKTDYNANMMREDRQLFDSYVKRTDAEDRAAEIRERYKKKREEKILQIDIKANADKVSALLTNSFAAKGYVINHRAAYQMLFSRMGKYTGEASQGPVENVAYLYYLMTQINTESKSKIFVTVKLIPNHYISKSNSAAHNGEKELRANVKSILQSVKREAESKN